MAKHTQTICRLLPTNCFSVFEHFVGVVLKGLNVTNIIQYFLLIYQHIKTLIAKYIIIQQKNNNTSSICV